MDLFDRLHNAAGTLDLSDLDAVSSAMGRPFVQRPLDHPVRREYEADGQGPVLKVELLDFTGGRGKSATLSLKLDPDAIDRATLRARLTPLLRKARAHDLDIAGFPTPVLKTESFEIGDHLFYISSFINAEPERLDAVGLQQRAGPSEQQAMDKATDGFLASLRKEPPEGWPHPVAEWTLDDLLPEDEKKEP